MKRQTKKLNSKKIIQVVTMLILCLILVFACIFGYSVYKDTAAFDSKKYDGSVIIVAHDRYFLDKVVTKVIEVERGTVSVFSGNYSDYAAKKKQLMDAKLKEYYNQQHL